MAKKQEEIKLTKYERARLIGARALQISHGAPFLLKLKEEDLEELKYNPIAIAKREFDEGVIPIEVLRTLPKDEAPVAEEQEA